MKVRITLYPYIHLQKEKERKKKRVSSMHSPPLLLFFQSGSSSYTDLISTTILAHQPSPSPPLHHCPLGFHKQAASPIGFPCQTAPLRFPRPGLLKFESRKEIKFLWFDDIFFLVEMKKFGRKRGREGGF